MLKLGIIGESNKENEKRLPIHPNDFSKISEKYREFIYIDKNYGVNFGYSDDELIQYVNVIDKKEIYEKCDIILILKYVNKDYIDIGPNKICWGWHHLVQNKNNVDIILDKKLTAISIEAMFDNGVYILESNRKMAGYASVFHALQLKGLTGYLIKNTNNKLIKAAVISYGQVGKGAVDGLLAMDINIIDVYTNRNPNDVTEKRENIYYLSYPVNSKDWKNTLLEYDIIVNCVLQNPLNPYMFLNKIDIMDINKKLFIIDISCDPGMGFDFAVSTTIENPIIKINKNVDFYGVDHSPSIYYNSITSEISKKIIDHIPFVIENKINDNKTLSQAVEINKGIIINDTINKFQNR